MSMEPTTASQAPKTAESLVFARRLKELRKERRLAQKELASAIGVHPLQISKYETGAYFPTVRKVIEIARVLQVGMSELFGEVGRGQREVTNLRLLRRFKELEALPKQDQEVIVKLIDAWIARGKAPRIVG